MNPVNRDTLELLGELTCQGNDADFQVCIRVPPLGQDHKFPTISAESARVVLSNATTKKCSVFTPDLLFDEYCPDRAVVQTLFDAHDSGSALGYLCNGFNVTVVSYGQVDSGKTSCLFEETPSCFEYCISQLIRCAEERPGKHIIGASFWEIVYDPERRAEVTVDLLAPAGAPTGELTNVLIESESQASSLFESARSKSQNFQYLGEGTFRVLNNRSHFFVRVTWGDSLSSVVASLHIVDLAGVVPYDIECGLRGQLGSEEQLNCTRIGLNQFRGIILDIVKDPSLPLSVILANKRSKLAQTLGPLIAENSKTFLVLTLKKDSSYHEADKVLDFASKAQRITIPCTREIVPGISLTEFTEFCEKHRSSQQNSCSDEHSEDKAPDEYNDFLYTIREQEALKSENSRKLEEYANALAETQCENEIKLHDMQIKNAHLRHKIGIYRENADTATVFAACEQEIAQLENKLLSLRTEITHRIDSAPAEQPLKSSVKSLSEQVAKNEAESFKLRKQEREWKLGKKCLEALTTKASFLQTAWANQKIFIQEHEAFFTELKEDVERSKASTAELNRELQSSLEENNRLAEEVKLVKDSTVSPFSGASSERTGKTLMNLLSRLQKGLRDTYDDPEMLQIIGALKHEVANIYNSMNEGYRKETVLGTLLSQLQEKPTLKERNKALRMGLGSLTFT